MGSRCPGDTKPKDSEPKKGVYAMALQTGTFLHGQTDRDSPGDGVCVFYEVGSKPPVERGSGIDRSQGSGFLVSCASWYGLRSVGTAP